MPYEEIRKREVFYARKGWELVNVLNCDTNNSCTSRLEKKDWEALMKDLAPIGPKLKAIAAAYETYYNDEGDEDEFKHNYRKEYKLIKTYENWYNSTFDYIPILGYDFSVGYMLNFWEARHKVLKYLDNPDFEIWMVASY